MFYIILHIILLCKTNPAV